MNTLEDTIPLMNSGDYKERFRAEYWQTQIRAIKLDKMLREWEHDKLPFKPTCSKAILYGQLANMENYLASLRLRAQVEDIKL